MPGPIIPGGRSMKEPTNPEQPARSRKSPTNEGAGGRALEKSLARPRVWALALLVCVVACASPTTKTSETPIASGEPSPRFAPGGPEAEEFGASIGYPKGNPATFRGTQWQVGSFSHLDEIFRGRLIHKASRPSRLVRVAEPPITWTLRGVDLTLDDYLARNPTTGLLIARGDEILVERYQYGRTDRHRFTSWSMAKTVTAMLIGIAIDEGRIRSVDDLAAAYAPALDGTEYGRTSLRHLLQMSSGVRFNEEASPGFVTDDLIQFVLGLDVTDGTAIRDVVAGIVAERGGIDVLVNNAGIGFVEAIEEADEARARLVWETNFWGPIHLFQAVLPYLRAQRARDSEPFDVRHALPWRRLASDVRRHEAGDEPDERVVERRACRDRRACRCDRTRNVRD